MENKDLIKKRVDACGKGWEVREGKSTWELGEGLLWRSEGSVRHFGYFMSFLLILYVIMSFGFYCDTLMDFLLNTQSPLTLKHNSLK